MLHPAIEELRLHLKNDGIKTTPTLCGKISVELMNYILACIEQLPTYSLTSGFNQQNILNGFIVHPAQTSPRPCLSVGVS